MVVKVGKSTFPLTFPLFDVVGQNMPQATAAKAASPDAAPEDTEARLTNLEAQVAFLSGILKRTTYMAATALAHTRCIECTQGMRPTPFSNQVSFAVTPIASRNNLRDMFIEGIQNASLEQKEWEKSL